MDKKRRDPGEDIAAGIKNVVKTKDDSKRKDRSDSRHVDPVSWKLEQGLR